MTQRSGSLPTDLHIVSTRDLILLQRGAAQPVLPSGTAGRTRSSLWSDGQDRVLDEMERREGRSHTRTAGARRGDPPSGGTGHDGG